MVSQQDDPLCSLLKGNYKGEWIEIEPNSWVTDFLRIYKDENGQTGLHLAAILQDHQVLQTLLCCGGRINDPDGDGNTVLHHLSKIKPQYFRRKSFEVAWENCPDLEKTDNDGNSALHHAVTAENEYVIGRLLESKVAVNQKNHYGDTPLHLAAEAGSTAIVRKLLTAGADPMQFNGSNKLPGEVADELGYSDCSEIIWIKYCSRKSPFVE